MKLAFISSLLACITSFSAFAAPSLKGTEWALLDIENNRRGDDPRLLSALNSQVLDVQHRALEVMGRIALPSFIPHVIPFLTHANASLRSMAAFSLGQMGSKQSSKALLQSFQSEQNVATRAAMALALGQCMDLEDGQKFIPLFLNEPVRYVRLASAQGLGQTWLRIREGWQFPAELWTTLLSDSQTDVGTQAAFALVRFPGEQKAEFLPKLVDAFKNAKANSAKPYLVRAIGNVKVEGTVEALSEILNSNAAVGEKVEAANGLSKQASDNVVAPLANALTEHNAQLVVSILEALKKVGARNTTVAADKLEWLYNSSSSDWVRSQALVTLTGLQTGRERILVEKAITNRPQTAVELAAIKSLAMLGETRDIDMVLTFATNTNLNVAGTALEALTAVSKEKMTLEWFTPAFQAASQRGDMRITCDLVDLITQFEYLSLVPSLAKTYGQFGSQMDGRVCILNAIALSKNSELLPVVEAALKDASAPVATAAAAAYSAITGNSPNATGPSALQIFLPTPSLKEVEAALKTKVVLKTTRGDVHIRMFPNAPLTAAMFTKLVKSHFYKGLKFHRVVPNFVAQGGDPRGDGWGGLDKVLPSEHSLTGHRKGTLGIATSGKDTGSCQFFINENDNLHLDGQYTVFGYVEKGLEHVLALEEGDLILN